MDNNNSVITLPWEENKEKDESLNTSPQSPLTEDELEEVIHEIRF